jgi:hypothetical protein
MSPKPLKPNAGRPVGQQSAAPARPGKAAAARSRQAAPQDHDANPLPAPGATPNDAAVEPDPVIEQAKRDIDAGLVDTDMRATPGLDAERRARLVPGPGGKPPSV